MSNKPQSVIEFTYGRNADLYEDVLKISSNAKPNDIKAAFFDRRAELYEEISSKDKGALSASERQFCEKKMDAIVLAFRILHNRETRRRYDNMTRKNRNKLNQSDNFPDRDGSADDDQLQLNHTFPVDVKSKGHRAVVTPEKDIRYKKSFDEAYNSDDDGTTVSTLGMRGAEGLSPVSSAKNVVTPSPNNTSNNSSVRIEKSSLSKNSSFNKSRDDQSVYSHHSEAESVNSDVLISRQRLNAKSMSVWNEDTDEDDETLETMSYVSDDGSQMTQTTSNTAGDEVSYVDTDGDDQTVDETDGGCLRISRDELKDINKGMAEGRSCFELVRGKNGIPNPSRMFHVISDEISGSFIDTVSALDQVLTAFNLTEENIDKVGDNIGNATDNLCQTR